jgi:hypothetical protein
MTNHAMGDTPGARHHIGNALKAGATLEKTMNVLQRCDSRGAPASRRGVSILREEIAAKIAALS